MSELTNRASYLKGLADGMKLDTETNEGRLINELLDFIGELAIEVEALDDEQGFIADQLDDLEEEVDLIEEELFDDYDDEYYDDDLEITCDSCGEELVVSADDLMNCEVICPTCGETIEFEFDCDCDRDCGEDCDCE